MQNSCKPNYTIKPSCSLIASQCFRALLLHRAKSNGKPLNLAQLRLFINFHFLTKNKLLKRCHLLLAYGRLDLQINVFSTFNILVSFLTQDSIRKGIIKQIWIDEPNPNNNYIFSKTHNLQGFFKFSVTIFTLIKSQNSSVFMWFICRLLFCSSVPFIYHE